MIKSTKIEDAEFVMSKDELTYAEVIEDFEEASSIHILTYNISKDKSDLLKALKKCDEDTEICIVSNIPGRWEKYFGEYYKSKARKIYHYIKVNYHLRNCRKGRSLFLFFKSCKNYND